ncbi:hypothetical protein GCM10010466_29510 [Planomonospora alba]|uniref:Uncharacterized protein n=1 Tax=Planomonospora alba TaxID=161354 RepID=A0ABP6N6X0_9ACTN
MPRKTFTVDYCDFCDAEEKETEAEQTFTINGKEALACVPHGKPLQKALDAFEKVARPIAQAEPPASVRGRSRAAGKGKGESVRNGRAYNTAKVRAWAKEENEKAGEIVYAISDTARIKGEVIDAYLAAHPE